MEIDSTFSFELLMRCCQFSVQFHNQDFEQKNKRLQKGKTIFLKQISCISMACLVYKYFQLEIVTDNQYICYMSEWSDESDKPALLDIPEIGMGAIDFNEGFKFQSPEMETGVPNSSFQKFTSKCTNRGKIGEGNNGSVFLYEKIKNKKKYAVKKMFLDEESENHLRKNFLEGCCLKDAPNIVKYYKMFSLRNRREFYLVMDYYDFPHLNRKGGYCEDDLKNIVQQILEGLKAIHRKNFYHRDIKPENILHDSKTGKVVIVDLGVGRRVKDGQAHSTAGTVAYRAPEMNIVGYDHKVDIWALGITIYELVCGVNPFINFKHMEVDNVQQMITSRDRYEKLKFAEPQWKEYSSLLQDLLSRMLKFLPKERYESSDCLKHPWFINQISPEIPERINLAEIRRSPDPKFAKSEAQKSIINHFQNKSISNSRKVNGKQQSNSKQIFDNVEYISDSDYEDEDYVWDVNTSQK